MKIIIEQIECKDMPDALRAIAAFIENWKNIENLEIVLGDC